MQRQDSFHLSKRPQVSCTVPDSASDVVQHLYSIQWDINGFMWPSSLSPAACCWPQLAVQIGGSEHGDPQVLITSVIYNAQVHWLPVSTLRDCTADNGKSWWENMIKWGDWLKWRMEVATAFSASRLRKIWGAVSVAAEWDTARNRGT